MSRQSTVRIALIGLGPIGLAHAAVHRELEGVEVVAVSDADEAEVIAYVAEHGGQPFTSATALLNEVRHARLPVDAIDVCDPRIDREQLAVATLDMTLPLLSELSEPDELDGELLRATLAEAVRRIRSSAG